MSDTNPQTSPQPVITKVKARVSVDAIKPSAFGLASHKYTCHDAIVSGRKTEEQILQPTFWALVAFKLKAGDEIRVLADDCSFRAELLVTYAHGTEIRVVPLDFQELEEVDYTALDAKFGGYEIKLRGVRKWCVIKIESGEVVKDYIPTQAAAAKYLEEHLRAFAS